MMDHNKVFLDGFGLAGYRSFGPEMQKMGPFSQINVFAGRNNSGKSTILKALSQRLLARSSSPGGASKSALRVHEEDTHTGPRTAQFRAGMAIRLDALGQLILTSSDGTTRRRKPITSEWERYSSVLIKKGCVSDTGLIWVPLLPTPDGYRLNADELFDSADQDHQAAWLYVCNKLDVTKGSVGNRIEILLTRYFLAPLRKIAHSTIPAFREIQHSGKNADEMSGKEIIERLAKMQHPDIRDPHRRQDFDTVQDFLRLICRNNNLQVVVPHNFTKIIIEEGERRLPLESYGSGTHQAIILATAAISQRDSILCIEEPELHMHPRLQRQFLRFLREKTTNQYFIATHSASILDAPDVTVFHVEMRDQASRCTRVKDASDRSRICVDMGYRPSDLIQANSVIWVEGPSDRVYLNAWLRDKDPTLEEGLHYSIMFYGGALCAHLTAEKPEAGGPARGSSDVAPDGEHDNDWVADFIELRKLNRFSAIVMDSDKRSQAANLKSRVERLEEEFNSEPGLAWITNCREIENYYPMADIECALQALCGDRYDKLAGYGQWECCYEFHGRGGKPQKPDKLHLARALVKKPTPDRYGLKDMLTGLIDFIRKANDLI